MKDEYSKLLSCYYWIHPRSWWQVERKSQYVMVGWANDEQIKKEKNVYIYVKAHPFLLRFGEGTHTQQEERRKEETGASTVGEDMASGAIVKMAAADYAAVRAQNPVPSTTNDISFSDRCEKYFAELNRWYVFY